MAVSEVEAVLEFLRENGLSESESAMMEDMVEKSKLRCFDFEKFLFPMVPPPPPVRIPAMRRRLEALGGVEGGDSSSHSSEDFVSLGSSITDLCSSEFTNPYGIQTAARGNSETSSDRLSQFGTARDYHDFDMQNDEYWYNEKTEDYDSPPYFDESDTYGCPSEDKFVMTLGTEKRSDSQLSLNNLSEGLQLDKPWPFKVPSVDDLHEVQVTDYYHLDEKVHPKGRGKNEKSGCALFGCSNTLCDCCIGAGGFVDMNYFTHNDIKSNTEFHIQAEDEDIHVHKREANEVGNSRELFEPEAAADEDEGVTADEPPVPDTNDDEYEIFNLRIIHRKNRTGFEENKDMPILLNSIIGGRYYVQEYLGSAAFSKVIQAHDLCTGMDVCLKIIKNDKDFFDQSLDEIKLLKFVNKHDPGDERHILRLYDYFYHQEHLFIVCELLRANLYEFQKYNRESGGEPYFTLTRLQYITRQCLEALEYLHHLGIIHCDLKPENILIKSYSRCEIKVIDLGSSCFLTDNLCLYIQSRSYRAPEVILGLQYDQKIDLWSLGCILAELCSGEVLFPNDALVMILARMIGMVGPIDMEMLVRGQETNKYFTEEYDLYHVNEETNQLEYIIPEESALEHHLPDSDSKFIDFIKDLLEINPQRRPTAREALEHPWLSHNYN